MIVSKFILRGFYVSSLLLMSRFTGHIWRAATVFLLALMPPAVHLSAGEEVRGAQEVDSPTVTDVGKSIIVVVGIDDYVHWKKLHNAVSDAKAVQSVFVEKFGFSAPISPLFNSDATKGALYALVEDQLRQILKSNDRLVLFFAGHGHTRVDTIGERNVETGFIVPVGARTGGQEQWGDYVKLEDFLETIGTLPARQVLVILDSCHSGFAVGGAVKSFRSAERYENDLATRVSRRVVTSAMRNQLARDNGPIPAHSLFAGTLIDGLNWGKSDLDGNGLVTSSELGLYLQQQVGQASESQQTPDSGSFHYDERGELVISLNNQTFDALKARAMTALHRGKLQEFSALTKEVVMSRPNSAEGLYLQYRLLIQERRIADAIAVIARLRNLRIQEGSIPLSSYDLEVLNFQLPYWKAALERADGQLPLLFEFYTGGLRGSLVVKQPDLVGSFTSYSVKPREVMRVRIANESDQQVYVYLLQIDRDGRILPIRLWEEEILWKGLAPNSVHDTLTFRDGGKAGMSEWRFFASTERVTELLAPLSYGTRGVFTPIQLPNNIQVKTLRYVIERTVGGK